MGTADLSPVDTVFGSVLSGSLGDVRNFLSKIKLGFFHGINTLDLDQTHVVVLIAETSLVAKDGAVHVQAGLSLVSRHVIVISTVNSLQ